jgi:glutathione S-transferase
MSNELKLYHSAASPNSWRVRIFLAEKGIAIPLVPVDLIKGEQFSDAYRAINPRGVVPALVLQDGTAIGEVLAKAMSFAAPGEHAALARWYENVSRRPGAGA